MKLEGTTQDNRKWSCTLPVFPFVGAWLIMLAWGAIGVEADVQGTWRTVSYLFVLVCVWGLIATLGLLRAAIKGS